MSPETYGDIPDTFPSKEFIPLGEHLFRLFRELGHEYFVGKTSHSDVPFFDGVSEFIADKFKIAVETAKKVMSGQIQTKDMENVLTTWFFPPVTFVRSDLQMGSTKLMYGSSTDITFVVVNDATYEIQYLVNGHMEEGVPVDYWYILQGQDDDVLDRRHLRLGHKLREIPKKTKDFTKSGFRILEIMRDIRNERTPQFSHSMYTMAMLWTSAAMNLFMGPSSWGTLSELWDFVNANKVYGRSDHYVCYVPWPPVIKLLLAMGRPEFTIRLAGLLTSHHLFINGMEPRMKSFVKEILPELWDNLVTNFKVAGVPTPRMTLGCHAPKLQEKKTYKNEEFDWNYPEGTRIKPFDWGITESEVFDGIYTDITHETPAEPIYGKEHVISTGIGK